MKVTLRNNAAHPFTLQYDARGGGWEVPLELRCVRTGKTGMIYGAGGSLNCMMDTGESVTIPPGGRFVTYELIYWGGPDWDWQEAGTYTIRARIDSASQGSWLSNTAIVRVDPIPGSERRLLETRTRVRGGPAGLGDPVLAVVAPGDGFVTPEAVPGHLAWPTAAENLARLSSIENQLTDCYLKKTLQWKRGVLAVWQAETQPDRLRARKQLEDVRTRLDPVTNEVVDLALARSCCEHGRWAELPALLDDIKEPSHRASVLRDALKRHEHEVTARREREQAVRNLFPDDGRLGVEIEYQLGSGRFTPTGYEVQSKSTFADLLKLLSERTKVPLDADDDFKHFPIIGRSIPAVALRGEMYTWASHFKATWQRRGDGYYLTATKADAGKP